MLSWAINIWLWLGLFGLYFVLDGMYTKNIIAIQELNPNKAANLSALQYLFGILGTYLCVKTSLINIVPIVAGAWLGTNFIVRQERKKKMKEGKKYDTGKLRWDLLPVECVEEVVKILTFGAEKYAPNNWQLVDNANERYYAALMRHIIAWRKGELLDPESGLSHLSHAACNVVFLMWLGNNESILPTLTKETTNLYNEYEVFPAIDVSEGEPKYTE